MGIFREIDVVKELTDETGIHAKLDVDNCKLHLQGSREQCDDSIKIYEQIESAIHKETLQLPYSIIANIIESDLGKKYYRESLAKEKITAQFFVQNGREIKIVAVNKDHCKKAKDLLLESLREENVSLNSEDLTLIGSSECNEIFNRFKDNQLVKISMNKSGEKVDGIVLHGLAETVVETKKEIEDFMEKELVRSEGLEIQENKAELLNGHLSYKVNEIREESNVSINIYPRRETVVMKGTREGIIKCKAFFSELCAMIVEKSKVFSWPGLEKFLSGQNGQPRITTIGMDHHVLIKKNKQIVQKPSTDGENAPKNPGKQEFTKATARDSRVGTKQESEIYDLCNFTSKEGINVSWKYGKIEQEKVRYFYSIFRKLSSFNSILPCFYNILILTPQHNMIMSNSGLPNS